MRRCTEQISVMGLRSSLYAQCESAQHECVGFVPYIEGIADSMQQFGVRPLCTESGQEFSHDARPVYVLDELHEYLASLGRGNRWDCVRAQVDDGNWQYLLGDTGQYVQRVMLGYGFGECKADGGPHLGVIPAEGIYQLRMIAQPVAPQPHLIAPHAREPRRPFAQDVVGSQRASPRVI